MNKHYETLLLELKTISEKDIITTSPGGDDGGFDGDDYPLFPL